jgi:glycosyltransferase involved in cell wall biosynthesis
MKNPKRQPKISIITPSYNQGKYIEKTILSVLGQDYQDYEYIVMDGGSNDGTIDILKKYGNRLKWISEKDKGQSDAINKGLIISKGKIVSYLNADDVLADNTLRFISEFFDRHPGIMWISGGYGIIDENGKKIRHAITYWKKIWLSLHKLLNTGAILKIFNYIPQPSTFFRKEVFKKTGLFDTSLEFTMDYDLWLRIIKKYPLKVTYKTLSFFRIHNDAKTVVNVNKSFNESFLVASRYTKSATLLALHKLHDILAIYTYKLFNR